MPERPKLKQGDLLGFTSCVDSLIYTPHVVSLTDWQQQYPILAPVIEQCPGNTIGLFLAVRGKAAQIETHSTAPLESVTNGIVALYRTTMLNNAVRRTFNEKCLHIPPDVTKAFSNIIASGTTFSNKHAVEAARNIRGLFFVSTPPQRVESHGYDRLEQVIDLFNEEIHKNIGMGLSFSDGKRAQQIFGIDDTMLDELFQSTGLNNLLINAVALARTGVVQIFEPMKIHDITQKYVNEHRLDRVIPSQWGAHSSIVYPEVTAKQILRVTTDYLFGYLRGSQIIDLLTCHTQTRNVPNELSDVNAVFRKLHDQREIRFREEEN